MITFSDSSFDSSLEKSKIVMLPIDAMNLTCETQIRSLTNEAAVLRYAALMNTEEGRARFPPIIVYRDGNGEYWIADGHHRVMAAMQCQLTEIQAEVREGTKADALWAAAEINSKNGLPLEGDDIRQAILMLIDAWPNRSLRSIADAVGCSKSYVGLVKTQATLNGQLALDPNVLSGKTIGKDGKLYPAIRIKKVKDKANPNSRDKESMNGDSDHSSLPQPVFTVSLSPNSTPASPVSTPSRDDHPLVHLTNRQQTLLDLYPSPACMEELADDILAAFSERNLFNLPLTLFEKLSGSRKLTQEAEGLLINFIGVKIMRSDDTMQSRILRDIFERLFDNNETIDKLMDFIKVKREN